MDPARCRSPGDHLTTRLRSGRYLPGRTCRTGSSRVAPHGVDAAQADPGLVLVDTVADVLITAVVGEEHIRDSVAAVAVTVGLLDNAMVGGRHRRAGLLCQGLHQQTEVDDELARDGVDRVSVVVALDLQAGFGRSDDGQPAAILVCGQPTRAHVVPVVVEQQEVCSTSGVATARGRVPRRPLVRRGARTPLA